MIPRQLAYFAIIYTYLIDPKKAARQNGLLLDIRIKLTLTKKRLFNSQSSLFANISCY
jgi:hypothetical protein